MRAFLLTIKYLKIMEKNEELLERLVNELAAQNKLITLLIAKENFSSNALFTDEEKLKLMEEKSESIIKWSYLSF